MPAGVTTPHAPPLGQPALVSHPERRGTLHAMGYDPSPEEHAAEFHEDLREFLDAYQAQALEHGWDREDTREWAQHFIRSLAYHLGLATTCATENFGPEVLDGTGLATTTKRPGGPRPNPEPSMN